MTITESLVAINTYPIPVNAVEKAVVDRGLTGSDEYSATIGASEAYRLATADLYTYLAFHPDIKEQEVSIAQQEKIKDNFLSLANSIYAEYDDPKYTGKGNFGFIGENYNG